MPDLDRSQPYGEDPGDAEMEQQLRRALAAPLPQLPAHFEKRIQRDIERQTAVVLPFLRRLLAAYALIATFTSAVILRSQGLSWTTVVLLLLAPLAIASALAWRGNLWKAPGPWLPRA